MPIDFSNFIVHGKSDHDLLALPIDEQQGTFTVQVQDGSLGARIMRWLRGQRSQTNLNQQRAADEFFHSVRQATGNDQYRTNLIMQSAGIRVGKPITVRQVKQVIQGLGLVSRDYGAKGAPIPTTRTHGQVAIVPTLADINPLCDSILLLKATYNLDLLKQYGKDLETTLKKPVAADDATFGQQAADLQESLEDIESECHLIMKDIENGTLTGPEADVQALKESLSALRTRIEKSMHNVSNASNARLYGTLDTTGNWNRVLYWQAAGIDFDRRLIEPLFEGKVVQNVMDLGHGAVNEVKAVTYTDGTAAAFKPIQFEYPRIRVAKYLGVSGSQPRNEVRNVAATRISEALGLNLMPKCGVGMVNGVQGLLAEIVDGETAYAIGRKHPLDPAGSAIHRRDELISNPQAMKDISNLEALDAILGMLDRHEANWMIKTDAHQNYQGIAAIDNDQTLQDATVDLANIIGPTPPNGLNEFGGTTGIRNVGLPLAMDAQTARTILDPAVRERAFTAVSGMLEPKALEDLGRRWDTLAKHITQTLEPAGRIINDWAGHYDELKNLYNDNIGHSLWGRAVLSNQEIVRLVAM